MNKQYLIVAYSEREEAKRLGCRWDPEQKSWFFMAGNKNSQEILENWDLCNNRNQISKNQYFKSLNFKYENENQQRKVQDYGIKRYDIIKKPIAKQSKKIENRNKTQYTAESNEKENYTTKQNRYNNMDNSSLYNCILSPIKIKASEISQENQSLSQSELKNRLNQLKNHSETKKNCTKCNQQLYHNHSFVYNEIYQSCECNLCSTGQRCNGGGSRHYQVYIEACDICLFCNKKFMCQEDACRQKRDEYIKKQSKQYLLSGYKSIEYPQSYSKFNREKKQVFGYEIKNLTKQCQVCLKSKQSHDSKIIYEDHHNPSIYTCQCSQIEQIENKYKTIKMEQTSIENIKIDYLCTKCCSNICKVQTGKIYKSSIIYEITGQRNGSIERYLKQNTFDDFIQEMLKKCPERICFKCKS